MNENRPMYGACVEIGIISESADGNRFTITSLTRDGVITPPIASMQDGLVIGDRVFFFLFDVGNGMILAKAGGD